jgi:hypothetical protein
MTHPDNELNPEQLERLMEDVSRLPREVAPVRDAWPEIRRRIEAQRVRPITAVPPSVASRRWRPSWWLGAAATIVVTAGVMLTVSERAARSQKRVIVQQPLSQGGAAPVTSNVALGAANPGLAAALDQYDLAARDLEAEVAARAANLSPATREVVRRSLATIDTAIADLRAALGANPRDAAVGQSLSLVYERKLEFLRRVRMLPGTGM